MAKVGAKGVSSSSMTSGADGSSVVKAAPKKRREWRNKVRKKAKREALRKVREAAVAVSLGQSAAEDVVSGDAKKQKKKTKRRKKHNVSKAVSPEKSDAEKKLEAGRFRFLNEQLYTCTGTEAFNLFTIDPESFHAYHSGFSEQTKKWPNHPLKQLIGWLNSKESRLVVLDLGCGEAKLAEAVENKHMVHSFDLVAVNERVTSCDMAKLPLEDDCADVAIFCLSLMGTNLADYLREARRCLKQSGILKIAEVTSRFGSIKLFTKAVCQLGYELISKKSITDYFLMFEFKKIATVENKRPFGLKLKPCLYKKR